ncbi:MFS transporter [Aspergillus puulaauensis]|uniref:Major facilitator superfamily (MFS) profile domain-containing protein n=1 Tax=Aspergillus puulaauensis TaxID=1220207 RepID=A0A7R8ANT7_9EURO|nr:uncharacterized protein APUU_41686S [Aspergillus puulaauensis]BCS25242.1 hypothetical protein APUU_41686S [Aspergillus puulaauensis]
MDSSFFHIPVHSSFLPTMAAEEDMPLLGPRTQPATKSEVKRVMLAGLPMLLLTAADGAFMLASFSTLGSNFGHLGDAAWAIMTYQVGVIIGQSIYSRLSDRYGRKQIMLFAHFLFIVGTFCAWQAPGFWYIVAARFLVGLGTAGMPLMLNTILNDICSQRSRSALHGGVLVGQFLGSIGGGYTLAKYSPQMVFRCEFIWALLSFAILCWFLPTSNLDDLPAQCNIRGAFVLAFSLVCLVVCLDNDLVAFWVPLALCIAAALVFGWLERHATVSLVPWERLQDRPMMYVIGIAPITAFIDMSILSLIPYYVQASHTGSIVTIGWLNMTFTVAEIFGHFLCSLIQRDRHVFIASRALSSLSAGVLLINKDWVKLVGLILAGLSSALANGNSMTMIIRHTEVKATNKDRGILYGIYHLVISIGNLLSQSMIIWMLQGLIARYIRSSLDHDSSDDIDKLVKKCLESFDYIDTLPDWLGLSVLQSFLDAIRTCISMTSTQYSLASRVLGTDYTITRVHSGYFMHGGAHCLPLRFQESRGKRTGIHLT